MLRPVRGSDSSHSSRAFRSAWMLASCDRSGNRSSIRCWRWWALWSERLPDRLNRRFGAEIDDFAAPFNGLFGRGQIDAVDAEIAGGDALLHADGFRIDGEHGCFHGEVIMQALGRLLDTLVFEPFGHGSVLIVLRDEYDSAGVLPLAGERICDGFHAGLIAAAVADEDDPFEAVRLERRTDICEEGLKGCLGDADRAGIEHVLRGRVDIAFWDEGH